MLDMYRSKPKRAVNPDIPRPNLFTHEKKLKDVQAAQDTHSQTVAQLQQRIEVLERKLNGQRDFMHNFYNFVMSKLRK
jgi:hypothetical protein